MTSQSTWKPELDPAIEDRMDSIIARSLKTCDSQLVVSNLYPDQFRFFGEKLQRAWEGQQQPAETPTVGHLEYVRLFLPWGEAPALQLWNNYVSLKGEVEGLRTIIQNALSSYAGEHGPSSVNMIATHPFYASVLNAIQAPPSYVPVQGKRRNLDTDQLLLAYLTDACSLPELRGMGFPRNLTTEYRYSLFQLLLKCQKGLHPDQILAKHRRIWIFIENIENVLLYATMDRRLLVKGLQHLVSTFGIFISFWLNINGPNQSKKTITALQEAFGLPFWEYVTDYLVVSYDEDVTIPEVIAEATRKQR